MIALFAEMYGWPLTVYLLSGWVQRRFPSLDPLSHDAGHLWYSLVGFQGSPHWNPIHIASSLLIVAGFMVLGSAWPVLYAAQRANRLATSGLYGHVRHPQYGGFMLILAGFQLQWPTLLTVAMFPALVTMYIRLARREEREAQRAFGAQWAAYAARTPAFVPWLTAGTGRAATTSGGVDGPASTAQPDDH